MSQFNESYLMFLGETICDPDFTYDGETNSSRPSEILLAELNQSFICIPDTADSQDQNSLQLQIFGFIGFIFLMLTAVLGNLIVMWIIYKHKAMHHGFNYFLFNMALADLFNALFNVGFSFTYNLYYEWWYGEILCVMTNFFGIAPTTISVFSMCALSIDRCQAICNPLRKRPLSRRRSLWLILIIWLAATLTALPSPLATEFGTFYFYNFARKTLSLRHACQANQSKGFNHMLFYIQYALPLLILSVTFGRIAWALKCTDDHKNCSIKAPSQTKSKSKAVKMLCLMVLTFMLFWAPYHFYHSFNLDFGQSVYLLIYWVAMSSTASNPVIYCFSNARFRIGFRYVFRFLPCVRFESDEYIYSQLFPERLRSMALSVHKEKDKLRLNGTVHMNEKATTSSNGRENSSFDLGTTPIQHDLPPHQMLIGQDKPLLEKRQLYQGS